MSTWGARATVVALWLAVACAGKATHDSASGGTVGDGSAGAAGVLDAAGAANAAGNIGDCQSSFRQPCFSDCMSQHQVDMVCEDGGWACPAGSTAPSLCPPTPCANSTAGCCPPGAAVATPLLCDAYGKQLSCPDRSTFETPAGGACPTPDYCDVPARTDLDGKACSFLGSTCFFGYGCASDTCACTQTDAGEPTWVCRFTNCTMR